jgi:hypothetical protein
MRLPWCSPPLLQRREQRKSLRTALLALLTLAISSCYGLRDSWRGLARAPALAIVTRIRGAKGSPFVAGICATASGRASAVPRVTD